MENHTRKPSRVQRYFKFYSTLVIIFIAFLGGILFGAWKFNGVAVSQVGDIVVNKFTDNPETQEIDFGIFWETWRTIQNKYYDRPVSEKDLFYGALVGMSASVQDPYTVFFDPEISQDFNEQISGTFEGIGIEIGIKDDQLVVIAPLPETPAYNAGVLAGDQIVSIDGTDTTGITLDLAVGMIRGEKGTSVELGIRRENEEDLVSISIVRETIKVESISWKMLDGNVAHIVLSDFNENTEKGFEKAVREIILEEPKGVILDLRNNPGGFLATAVNIAGYFVAENDVVLVEDFGNGNENSYVVENGEDFIDYPMIVLVNAGTASASEIVAGAIQDHGIATVLGEQTFGKGTVQELNEFADGSSLKITVAEWLTPNGRSIDKEGITPDVIVEITLDDIEAGLDPQLNKAVELLTE
ncbi:S41 family peptidase [Patescibacteria group bacterium]|nr:S41 family peptidase [Patescibacteria group bacterium]MBU1074453.1 S41 family peptidase [Patescibacteria group bacterium]MBU1952106.1 S41 family peptidase [Patescibacteria group bacterium]